jgi:hypothetical protein
LNWQKREGIIQKLKGGKGRKKEEDEKIYFKAFVNE